MSHKILVTGSNGQLGQELLSLSRASENNWIFTDVDSLDITDKEVVENFLSKQKFNFLVNCAAYTAVDLAESEREAAEKVNVHAPSILAEACSKSGTHLIHISTDFVFNGSKTIPLKENEGTSPINYYGETKLRGEDAIREKLNEHYIIRTSWLYSVYGKNFVKTMLRLAESKSELNVVFDQVGTPTYALDLAEVIVKIISTKEHYFGTYHYSNEGVASWYDFAKAVFEYCNISIHVNPVPSHTFPTPAKRPHFSVMDKEKIKSTMGISIPYWTDSLKACLEELKKANY